MGNALNLKEINQEEALNLLRFNIKTEGNLFLFGRRGIGKTFLSLQAAREMGYKISIVNLSVIERPDLAGWPILNDASDVVVYKQPYYLPKLEGGVADQILLFDEVDKCHSEITAPLLELLQFRTINGKPINAAACILTGNLISEGAYSNNISTALLDRGAKFILSFNFQHWIKWARDAGLNELILGFLIRHPELACGEIESGVEFASPSPRGWTLASNAMQEAAKLNLDDLDTVESIIAGYVGAAAAIQFRIWHEHYKRFEPIIYSLLERGTCGVDYAKLDQTEKFVFVLTACHLAKLKCFDGGTKPKIRYVERLCRFLDDNAVEKEIELVGIRNSFPMNIVVQHRALLNCQPFFSKVSALHEATQ
jgi:hypothetical protein